jgi:hypothetical protein
MGKVTTSLSIRCVVIRLSIKHLANPCRGDACIMKPMLHDKDDERSIEILKNCRRAMHQGG